MIEYNKQIFYEKQLLTADSLNHMEDGIDRVVKGVNSLPNTFPNPYPLTFTGEVEAVYDGSEPLVVDIPSGSGSWVLLNEINFDADGTFTITEDVDGNPLDEQIIYIVAHNAAVSASRDTNLAINGERLCGWAFCSKTTPVYHVHYITALGDRMLDFFATLLEGLDSQKSKPMSVVCVEIPGNIKKIQSHYQTMPAGSWVKVYGLR